MKGLSYFEKIQWIKDALGTEGEKNSVEIKRLQERNLLKVLFLLFAYVSAGLLAVVGVCYLGFGNNLVAWVAVSVLFVWGGFKILNYSFMWVEKTHGSMARKFPKLYDYYWKKYHLKFVNSKRDENLAASHEMGKKWAENGFAWMVASERLGEPAKARDQKQISSAPKSRPVPIPASEEGFFSSTVLSVAPENPPKTHFSQKPVFQTVLYVLLIAVAILYLVEKLGSLLPLAIVVLIMVMVIAVMGWSARLVYKKSKRKAHGVFSVLLLVGIFALVLGIYIPTLVNRAADYLGLDNDLFNGANSLTSLIFGSSSNTDEITPTLILSTTPSPRVMVTASMKYTEEQKLQFMEQGIDELQVVSKALNENFQILTNAASLISEQQNLVPWPEYASALYPRFDELKLWATEGFTNTAGVWISPSLCLRLQLGEQMEALPFGTSQQLSPVCQYYVGTLEAAKGMIGSLSEVFGYAEASGWIYEEILLQYGDEVEQAFLSARAYERVVEENLIILNALQAVAGVSEIEMFVPPDGGGYVDYMEYFYNNPPEEVVKITATPGPIIQATDYLSILQDTPTPASTATTAATIPATLTPTFTLAPQVPCSPESVAGYEFAGRDPHVEEPSLWHVTGNFYDSPSRNGQVVEYSEECGGWIFLFQSSAFGGYYWDLVTWIPYVNPGTYIKMVDDADYPYHVKFVMSDEWGNEYGDFLKEEPPATPTPAAALPDTSSYECQTALAGHEPTYQEDPSYGPPALQDWKWLILRTNMEPARAYYTYCGGNTYWVAVYQHGLDGEKDWYWTHIIPPGTTENDLWWPVQVVFPCNWGEEIQTCVSVEIRGQR